MKRGSDAGSKEYLQSTWPRTLQSDSFRAALRVASLLLMAVTGAGASAPVGIPRDLARKRASQISDVRYRLTFTLIPHAATTSGSEELTFKLRAPEPVLLDFRDGMLSALKVNGSVVAVKAENGHLELPGEKLRAGDNAVDLQFTSRIAPAGKALTRFEDRDDNTEYIYTLFVPMDASMAFPCFDQPDLKARFRLEVIAPESWTVISNTPIESWSSARTEQRRSAFRETLPISTYLFAFAAGSFRRVHEAPGMPGLYVRHSRLNQAETEALAVQQIAAEGTSYLSSYFAQPFPFPKYDMVLIPGLAYGGMEHAGATFLREESVLFRTAPTHTDLLNRDILVLHELTHQWFGDLVTMRWFDDLWLKEGFAQYMAYRALASLKPDENAWKRFYEAIKPGAYEIDSTQGTTPIYQDIPNLKDAKSAYGAIVYSKAPALLKQLAFVLGPEAFRGALRLYLKEHAYSDAEWSDLVHSFERASGRTLSRWAETWIRHRGMPQVDVAWSCDSDRLSRLSLSQHDVLGTSDIWPIATQILLSYTASEPIRMRVELDKPTMAVSEATGKPCPSFIFVNDQDHAYGRFLLDSTSRESAVDRLGGVQDIFLRTLLWGSLWDSVRQADFTPRAYISLAQKLLAAETDQSLTQSILQHTTTTLHRYVSMGVRGQFVPALEGLAGDRMIHSTDPDLRITWFRGLCAFAETPEGLRKLEALLNGELSVPGVQLRPLDRWSMVTALIAAGDPQAQTVFEAERLRDPSGDGQKYAYAAEAARADSQTKQRYFDDYLHNSSRPEDWIEQSLGAFDHWNQSALTESYLKPALEALPEIKRDRKIFFLVEWLSAFVEGQQTSAAQAEVYQYLRTTSVDQDLRLKILQVVDELDRTITIRRRFPE